jgi:hypothetical protein
MSRRGRGREAAISLFSFQDIITSVTAIMILLVLILSLELVTRVPGRQVSAEDRQTAADLRRSLDEMREKVAAIRHDTGDAREAAIQIAGFDAEETRSRTAAARRRLEAGRSEIRSLTSRLSETRSRQREAERSLSRSQGRGSVPEVSQIEALEARTREIEAANRDEAQRQEGERRRLASQPRQPSRLVFNAAPEDGRAPVLLDVSERGLVGLDPAEGKPVRLGAFRMGPPGALGRWLEGLDQDSRYVVVLLRPSGVEAYDAVRDAVVEAGLGIGLELIGESIEVGVNDHGEAG